MRREASSQALPVSLRATVRIDLDRELLANAAAIMGTSTSEATINEALRRIVVHERQLHHLEKLAADTWFALRAPEVVQG